MNFEINGYADPVVQGNITLLGPRDLFGKTRQVRPDMDASLRQTLISQSNI